jgi:NADH:ubiquinone oxidoreductase subunit D
LRFKDFKINLPFRKNVRIGMEELIHHFKLYTEGFSSDFNINSVSIESPKGEFSLFVASDGSNRP